MLLPLLSNEEGFRKDKILSYTLSSFHFVLVFPSWIGYTIVMAVSPGDKKGDTFEYSIKKLDYCNRQRSTV